MNKGLLKIIEDVTGCTEEDLLQKREPMCWDLGIMQHRHSREMDLLKVSPSQDE